MTADGFTPKGVSEADALQAVGEGWSGLVTQIYRLLPEGVQIVQVKEKFGSLRVYSFPFNAEFQKQVTQLEIDSGSICEVCGEPGELDDSRYWLKTLCQRCKENRYKETK